MPGLVACGQFTVGFSWDDEDNEARCQYLVLCTSVNGFERPVVGVDDHHSVGEAWVTVEVVLGRDFHRRLPVVRDFHFCVVPLIYREPPCVSGEDRADDGVFGVACVRLVQRDVGTPSSLVVEVRGSRVHLGPRAIRLICPFLRVLGGDQIGSIGIPFFPFVSFLVFCHLPCFGEVGHELIFRWEVIFEGRARPCLVGANFAGQFRDDLLDHFLRVYPYVNHHARQVVANAIHVFGVVFSIRRCRTVVVFSNECRYRYAFPAVRDPCAKEYGVPPFPNSDERGPCPVDVLAVVGPFRHFLFLSAGRDDKGAYVGEVPFNRLFGARLGPIPAFRFILYVCFCRGAWRHPGDCCVGFYARPVVFWGLCSWGFSKAFSCYIGRRGSEFCP